MRTLKYRNLILTGRAVKVVGKHVIVTLAGQQNDDGSNRIWHAGFGDRDGAQKAAASLLSVLREGVAEDWICDDVSYNDVLSAWAGAVKRKVERQNDTILADAEAAAKIAPPEEVLIDSRGLTLKEWVLALLGIDNKMKGKGK